MSPPDPRGVAGRGSSSAAPLTWSRVFWRSLGLAVIGAAAGASYGVARANNHDGSTWSPVLTAILVSVGFAVFGVFELLRPRQLLRVSDRAFDPDRGRLAWVAMVIIGTVIAVVLGWIAGENA